MSSVTSNVCKGGSLSALLAFMRLQVPLHSLHALVLSESSVGGVTRGVGGPVALAQCIGCTG
jgi:hypothetical protein